MFYRRATIVKSTNIGERFWSPAALLLAIGRADGIQNATRRLCSHTEPCGGVPTPLRFGVLREEPPLLEKKAGLPSPDVWWRARSASLRGASRGAATADVI
jgi:hypothetical protein